MVKFFIFIEKKFLLSSFLGDIDILIMHKDSHDIFLVQPTVVVGGNIFYGTQHSKEQSI